jgi:hypothetical protein
VDVSNQLDPAQVLAEAQRMSDAYLACMSDYDVLNLNRDEYWDIAQSCAVQVDPDSPYQ